METYFKTMKDSWFINPVPMIGNVTGLETHSTVFTNGRMQICCSTCDS